MITEEYEKEIIQKITEKILEENKLSKELISIDDLKSFFRVLADNQNENKILYQYIAFYMYYKFSEKEVRLRKVSSRTFEEFIGAIYGLKPTDDTKKVNPKISEEIKKLSNHYLTEKESNAELVKLMNDWTIEEDLIGNKREKADLLNESVEISIKTLKGRIKEDPKANTEINIGSMSYRSLFINIYNENLGDRKAGLGSGAQVLKILRKIESDGQLDKFKGRLKIFLDYLYANDDFFIAFKSDTKMQLLFFEGHELVTLLTSLLEKDLKLFSDIFYRWENNNLRIKVNKLLNPMRTNFWLAETLDDIVDYPLYKDILNPFSKKNMIILDLEKALNNTELLEIVKETSMEYVTKITDSIISAKEDSNP